MPTAIHRAYKFRLEPTQAQAEQMFAFAGMCRFVSNWMWQQRQDYYAACGKSIGYNAQAAQLKPLKLHYPWLKEAPSQILQQALRNLDQAYQRFFKGEASYPKPRKRGKHDSFRFPQGFTLCGNYVRLPKLGHLKFRLSRTIRGVIKSVTVSRKGKHWYVSFHNAGILRKKTAGASSSSVAAARIPRMPTSMRQRTFWRQDMPCQSVEI